VLIPWKNPESEVLQMIADIQESGVYVIFNLAIIINLVTLVNLFSLEWQPVWDLYYFLDGRAGSSVVELM
jgi:hypothetical protein